MGQDREAIDAVSMNKDGHKPAKYGDLKNCAALRQVKLEARSRAALLVLQRVKKIGKRNIS